MPTPLNSLSIREKILLVEDLRDSIAEDQAMLPFTPEQKDELNRRLDACEADQTQGRKAGEVIAGIKKRL